MALRRYLPWLRTLVALPIGLVAIVLFHRLAAAFLPGLYGSDLDNDPERAVMLLLIVLAGVVGSFFVAMVSRHRLWLHMALFFLVMLAIDVQAVLDPLAPQPIWFKTLVILALPVQVWIGGVAARRIFRNAFGAAA